jgi:hypothetical protein
MKKLKKIADRKIKAKIEKSFNFQQNRSVFDKTDRFLIFSLKFQKSKFGPVFKPWSRVRSLFFILQPAARRQGLSGRQVDVNVRVGSPNPFSSSVSRNAQHTFRNAFHITDSPTRQTDRPSIILVSSTSQHTSMSTRTAKGRK